MKRHFSFGFKALAACAMSAMLAVSCYDDSKLWEEIEGLEERVAALEEKLNTEVATLNSKLGTLETAYKAADADLVKAVAALTEELDALDGVVDGYITSNDAALKAAIDELKKADAALAAVDTETLAALAKLGVVSVETNANGNVVITFTDKTTLEVPANPESGLVTIVDGHWAVVVDGEVTVLDALVLPDTTLDFRVGDDNTLYVSYDAGKTWESTGIVVDGETLANVVTGVKYNKGDEFVTLVVGKTEYQFPVYEADNSSLVLGRTDVFFNYGASKTIYLEAEAIVEDECYVISKPDGWKANLDGTVLTVTAPSKELVENGAGELEGEVLIHATTVTGTCKVVKLDVSTGVALSLSYEDGNVSVFNALTYLNKRGWMEMTDFYEICLGITPIEDFIKYASFEEFIADNRYNFLDSMSYFAMMADYGDTWYQEGVYEEQNITLPLSTIAEIAEFELDADTEYVLWILPTDSQGMNALVDQALYTTTGHYSVVTASNQTYNNADISIEYFGADGIYVGAVNKTEVDLRCEGDLAMYLMYGPNWQGGPWLEFEGGNASAIGTLYTVNAGELSLTVDVKLGDIVLPNYMGERFVDAGKEYYVYLLPYYKDRQISEYSIEEIIAYPCCKTEALKYNEDVAAEVVYSAQPYSFEYTITAPANGITYFYTISKEEYADYFGLYTDEELADVLKDWCSEPVTGSIDLEYPSYMGVNPGQEWCIVTYSTAGEYCGGIEITTIKTPTVDEYIPTLEAGATFTLTKNVTLTNPIQVSKDITINLNGKNITCDASDVFVVTNGTLTLNGNGVVWGSSDNSSSSCAVWAKENGKVVINGGTYKVGDDTSAGKTGNWRNDCIYARDNAQITVNGGEFMYTGENPDGHTFVLNQKDGSNAKIVVTGGTFHKFNPSASNGENPVANFVAAGYEARETAENVYTVGYPTPVGKQWISADATFATTMFGMPTTTLFDLGVFAPDPSVPFNTFTFSVDYGTMMGNPDPMWLFASYYGTYSVEPKDATSGVLVIDMMMQGSTMNIPYSNLDADSVTFNFTVLGMGEMNFTRPAEQVEVLLTPPTSGDDL